MAEQVICPKCKQEVSPSFTKTCPCCGARCCLTCIGTERVKQHVKEGVRRGRAAGFLSVTDRRSANN